MTDDLPDWYPLANATDAEIDAWLEADQPPYDEMRRALPWLDEPYQFDTWIESVREFRSRAERGDWLRQALPRLSAIPLPPRRLVGRLAQ